MNPRHSVNRALFESSLELKCLLFFGIGIIVVIAVSFFLYWTVTGFQLRTQNPRTAYLLAVQYLMFQHRTFLQETTETQTDDFQLFMDILDRRLRKEEFRSNFIWIPDEKPESTNPLEADGKRKQTPKRTPPMADELEFFQNTILRKYDIYRTQYDSAISPDEYGEFVDTDETYHYYQVIRGDTFCNHCHNPILGKVYEPGEMIGAVHVEIPRPPGNRDVMARSWAMLLGVAIITAFLSLIAFDIVIRWAIISPLRNLRGVAEGISRGETSKRAELHTGDEFESLAEAFNRMLRHLITAQDKLKRNNVELQSRVDELAFLSVQLDGMNRMKGDFLATMSHELRTPLNSILGFSNVLESIDSLTEKQKKYVSNITKSGQTLLTMINDILDMAKMDAGKMEIRLSTFSIGHIIDAQCDMAKPLLDRKNLVLQSLIESELPQMTQDQSRVQQILNNLLSNAIKFTPEGGTVKVFAKRILYSTNPEYTATTEFLELKVTDNGIGIAQDDQLIIFNKFRQGASSKTTDDGTLTREHSGSGLGLSIVKEICRMLEGDIGIESELGLGSTFTVHLPWTLTQKDRSETDQLRQYQFGTTRRIAQLSQSTADGWTMIDNSTAE